MLVNMWSNWNLHILVVSITTLQNHYRYVPAIGYIHNRNACTSAQKNIHTQFCCFENTNLFSNVTDTLGINMSLMQISRLLMLHLVHKKYFGKGRKLHWDEMSHTEVHKMYTFQTLVHWVLMSHTHPHTWY